MFGALRIVGSMGLVAGDASLQWGNWVHESECSKAKARPMTNSAPAEHAEKEALAKIDWQDLD
jgi:hypothetical protein